MLHARTSCCLLRRGRGPPLNMYGGVWLVLIGVALVFSSDRQAAAATEGEDQKPPPKVEDPKAVAFAVGLRDLQGQLTRFELLNRDCTAPRLPVERFCRNFFAPSIELCVEQVLAALPPALVGTAAPPRVDQSQQARSHLLLAPALGTVFVDS